MVSTKEGSYRRKEERMQQQWTWWRKCCIGYQRLFLFWPFFFSLVTRYVHSFILIFVTILIIFSRQPFSFYLELYSLIMPFLVFLLINMIMQSQILVQVERIIFFFFFCFNSNWFFYFNFFTSSVFQYKKKCLYSWISDLIEGIRTWNFNWKIK